MDNNLKPSDRKCPRCGEEARLIGKSGKRWHLYCKTDNHNFYLKVKEPKKDEQEKSIFGKKNDD